MTDEAPKQIARGTGSRARSLARKLAMQALYQWQLTQQDAVEIKQQYLESEDSAGVDEDHFVELLTQVIARHEEITTALKPFVDRPLEQLDPVEAAILMIGMYELQRRLDVPYRVVINEGVDLCKRFGATDAHKYINAVLDRAAREIRAAERQ
ncbi:transcription antitermination factor NusB [Steroidobacter agaridevorans]|uniref:transcription antitermination factor NusB n=1 Tax=Steroidobacter agaridevorans TaxID=2695856 RepID=UPI00132A062C|nr:transcription antitermination factor NusB [Steroidobacter agaridevorans]GFE90756.1 N utilization substance protein B [Steroidobacter agaridevorans]